MAGRGWIWDPTRSKWYQIDHASNCYVFQDGDRIPIHSSPQSTSAQSTRSGRTGSTASASSMEGRSSSKHEDITRQFANMSMSMAGQRADQGNVVIRNNKHNIIQDPSGRETSMDPELLRQGVKAVVRVGQPSQHYETLDPKFKRRHRSFYSRGKVFRILWPEPAGSTDQGSVYSSGAFNEKFHMKIRWFVVIREGATFCSCLPIATYTLQGVGKRGVVKEEHCVIYTGDKEPAILQIELPGYGEREMRPSIRVRPRSKGEKLDELSRLNYAKVYTVEHNVKVYEFGDVHKDSMRQLVKNFKAVWKMDVSSGGTASGAEPIILEQNEDDGEEEDDDDDPEDDEEGEGNDDDDDDDDDNGGENRNVYTAEQSKGMNPQEMATHNYYVSHYVQAYRNNNLHPLATWLQNAAIPEQQEHIKQAQDQTRKVMQQGKGKGRR